MELHCFDQISEKTEFDLINPSHFSTFEKYFKAIFHLTIKDRMLQPVTSQLTLPFISVEIKGIVNLFLELFKWK